MWLPLTSRRCCASLRPRAPYSTSSTHGPAALTTALARTRLERPAPSVSVACQASSDRRASLHLAPTRISAPRWRASMAFSTTSRLSSTQQS